MSFIFNSIIAVVIGGVLLTGGYGSVVGIVLGTLTFSIVNQGIFFTGFDANWSSLIIGILLLLAVLMNNTFRNMALTYAPRTEREGPLMATPAPRARPGSTSRSARSTSCTTSRSKVDAGEVLCLLGDNGAGKSTLIKILSGVHKPTSGTVLMDGKEVVFDSPREASDDGHRDRAPVRRDLPADEHRALASSSDASRRRSWGPLKIYRPSEGERDRGAASHGLGITRIDDGDRLVGGLSGGERQALAIARAVHFGASVLILDEPTAALGVKQASHVLRIVLQARQKGLAVIFITHQVTHAMAVGDHFAVLIRGAMAANFRKGEKTREEITDLMAGGEAMAELGAEIESYMDDPRGPSAAAAESIRLKPKRAWHVAVRPAPVRLPAGSASVSEGFVRVSRDAATRQ